MNNVDCRNIALLAIDYAINLHKKNTEFEI